MRQRSSLKNKDRSHSENYTIKELTAVVGKTIAEFDCGHLDRKDTMRTDEDYILLRFTDGSSLMIEVDANAKRDAKTFTELFVRYKAKRKSAA